MQMQFQYGSELITLQIEADGSAWRIRLPDGTERRVTLRRNTDDVLHIAEEAATADAEEAATADAEEAATADAEEAATADAEPAGLRVFQVPFARLENGIGFSYGGMTYTFTAPASVARNKAKTTSGVLTAPMAGVVADVMVTEGQSVEAYQPLAVIEAMKVMSTLDAPFAGTVKRVYVQPKQQVAHGAVIVEIVPDANVAANERE